MCTLKQSCKHAIGVFAAIVLLTGSVVFAQEVPFVGVVLENGTPVRAGAGQPFYVVGELNQGDQVTVREVIVGWLRIEAPRETYSYISKTHVELQPDGRTGIVITDRSPIKAGSLQGPAQSYQTQKNLDRGHRLQIVEEVGSFYKVVPVEGATVFLPPGSIRRATQADLALQEEQEQAQQRERTQATEVVEQVTEEEEVVEEQAVPTREEPAVVDEAALEERLQDLQARLDQNTQQEKVEIDEEVAIEMDDAPSLDRPMDKEGSVTVVAESSDLAEVEERMIPNFKIPVEEQPLDQMESAYRALLDNESLSARDRRVVQLRLAAIDRNRQLAEALRSIAAAQQQAESATTQATRDTERRARSIREAEQQARRDFDIQGRLLGSSVYDGQNLPRMLRLVDTRTGRTLGYLQPADSNEAAHLVGQKVGIVGDIRYDATMRLNVIEVEHIDHVN